MTFMPSLLVRLYNTCLTRIICFISPRQQTILVSFCSTHSKMFHLKRASSLRIQCRHHFKPYHQHSFPCISLHNTSPHNKCILNFLSISNFNSNTTGSKPSVIKDPLINGLNVTIRGDFFGVQKPSLDEIEISKLELSEKFGFELRDLRALQNVNRLVPDRARLSPINYKYGSPTFFVRPHAFLAHLGSITALISSDECYLFNVMPESNGNNGYDSDSEQPQDTKQSVIESFNILNKFDAKLRSTLILNNLPFEFHCLEAVCKAVVSKHRNNVMRIEQVCDQILNHQAHNKYISNTEANNISNTKIELVHGITSAKACVDALHELLNNPDDLATMYLNEDNKGNIKEDKQLELLLENYLWQFDEILDRLQLFLDEISMYERSIGYLINKQRNDIIRMNLKLSVLTCGFAGAALPAAVFGMNLLSHLEAHPYAFWCGAAGFGCFIPFIVWRHFKIDLESKNIYF
eukprot:151982_1